MTIMRDLRGKKVVVVGLALTGVAVAKFCARRGARVIVSDQGRLNLADLVKRADAPADGNATRSGHYPISEPKQLIYMIWRNGNVIGIVHCPGGCAKNAGISLWDDDVAIGRRCQ